MKQLVSSWIQLLGLANIGQLFVRSVLIDRTYLIEHYVVEISVETPNGLIS